MGIVDKAKDAAEDLADKAGDLAGKAKESAGDLAGKAKTSVGGLADQHGDTVAEAVHKGTHFVDDKTGGKIKVVTDKVDELTDKAVGALKSPAPQDPPSA
jgi:uncharacterized protein YjbJ (UPF0337 family)